MLQGCSDTPYIGLHRNNDVPAWGYRKMTKAFGLINAFALLAGAVSLVLWG